MGRTKICATKMVKRPRASRTSYRTFNSTEAEERYNQVIAKRTLCTEKGFLLTDAPTMGYAKYVHQVISTHNWRKFASHPSAAVVPVVREFYAHLLVEDQQTVYVRGVEVPIDRTTINQFYGLWDIADQHSDWSESVSEAELDQMLASLCAAGTTWETSAQGARRFPRNDLTAPNRLWYHFLKANLMPSTHVQTVSKDRALLLDSIVIGRAIDVGLLLHQQLHACARKQGGSLWFLCLNTELCRKHGVQILDHEEQLSTKGAISPIAVARIMKGAPQEDAELEEQDPATQATSSGHAGASSSGSQMPRDMANSLRMLEQRMSLQEVQQFQTMEMLQQMYQQHQQYWAYAKQRDTALKKSLQKNFTKPVFQFPSFPETVFNPIPQADEAAETEDEDATEMDED